MTDVRVLKFEPNEPITCDELLLADSLLKEYCDFVCDNALEDVEQVHKSALGVLEQNDIKSNGHSKSSHDDSSSIEQNPEYTLVKQLTLARSCLADVIYAVHCLGTWCAKRTIKLYMIEFSRILNSEMGYDNQTAIDLLGSTLTVLQGFYARLEDMTSRLKFEAQKSDEKHDDLLSHGSSLQMRTLLHYIRDHEPPPSSNWPICIIHVHRKVVAKVIALWLREISSERSEYSFIKPNYMVGSSRKHRNRMAVDNFDLHHEASIRDFRFGKCNTLVISSMNERCVDTIRCNLVITYDFPRQFGDYMQAKLNCRYDSSKYILMLNSFLGDDLDERLSKYMSMEKSLNSMNKKDVLEPYELEIVKSLEGDYPPYPQSSRCNRGGPATVLRSVNIITKYCAKLPSDSFTKLSPEWTVEELENNADYKFYCKVRLPINSPIRQIIYGPPAPTRGIAIRLAAFRACKVLHEAGELDDNMLPIKKDSMKTLTPWLKDLMQRPKPIASNKGQSVGSTKHRQYYRKRIASVFSGPKITGQSKCYLYKFKMVLTCPIPDEQNRRGRKIIDPGDTNRNYAIICCNKLPKICSFPVFTRSGEVMISIDCIDSELVLSEPQVQALRTFHVYTFSKVLRLEKYPTLFEPDSSPFTVLLAPVIDEVSDTNETDVKTKVDWNFVNKIVTGDHDSIVPKEIDRKNFKFNHDDYVDAVVIPWYRLTDKQQFAYYVAEICTSMTPKSPFPDELSGFKTFIDYYASKYKITIYNEEQPVLDVDHTSARLNLLTPRYVNRKGKTLPSSTAKTRRESRESLDRKQLLIPELCTIHPFPASFWRKAVCLPAIFYRLNYLFLAEELRREVAKTIKVGFVEPPENFDWPNLNFGWSLKDIISMQSSDKSFEEDGDYLEEVEEEEDEDQDDIEELKLHAEWIKDTKVKKPSFELDPTTPTHDYVIDHFDPSKVHIPDTPLDSFIEVGFAEPPADFEWRNLNFNWSLKDVLKLKSSDKSLDYYDESDDYYDSEEHEDQSPNVNEIFSGDKPKKPTRIRELFVPFANQNFNEKYSHVENEITKADSPSPMKIEYTSQIRENNNENVIKLLKQIYDDITFDGKNGWLSEWRDIYIKLSKRIEKTLQTNPDLFESNDTVDQACTDVNIEAQPTFGQLLPNRDDLVGPNEDWKNIKFDPTRAEIKSTGPGPSVILQALTMSNASDGINLERLETVGDSFLKYSITAYLYCMYPKLHEGKLSYLRSTEISNANLYQLGRAKNLGELMSATKFEPNDNWLPPGYTIANVINDKQSTDGLLDQSPVCQKKLEIDKALAEVPYDLIRQHSIPDKSIADCVEALIGAYLTASGSRAALLFMQWFGLRVVPPTYDLERDLNSQEPETSIWRWLDIPPSPLIYSQPTFDDKFDQNLIERESLDEIKAKAMTELDRLYHDNKMDKFEEEIQYTFKDKAYLVQAFTHNSFHENHVTDCHQRLEFLGDALLDYLITRYLFEDPRCHSPGKLTDLRSALVNNTFFASLAVKYNFYKYLMFISDELSHAIGELVKKFRFNTKDTITTGYTLLIGEGESEYAEEIEVPKALGDVFESVAGAIYLDSGMSLDQVWKVYFKMMKPEIEYFSQNVPKSPIRKLLESKPQNVRFSPSELAPDKRHRVMAEVFGLGRFIGVGRNKHSAKSTAAKRALRMLEIKKMLNKNDKDEQ